MTCCSGASFVPAPDAALDSGKRVNFTFGMVLGVDDFRQEHRYLAARDESLLRQVSGYGVLSGLDVRATADEIDPTKVEVRVAPGVALLPDGKLVGVNREQCASLDDWLSGPSKKESSGAASVYVVLRYAESSGTPVPIPGEPCRDESALQADSRIADSFTLDFTWSAPQSGEDDALRSFAAWLRRIPVHAAPSPEPTLVAFQQAVEDAVGAAIAAGWPSTVNPPLASTPEATPDESLVIPYDAYAEFINAAFDVWIRRLRGLYLAKHGPVPDAEDAAERGLLLAAIDCTLSAGSLSALGGTRLLGRPQLVHQRLLQEWLLDKPDDAPRDAHYVLGRQDPRLPNAQDLYAMFRDTPRQMVRVAVEESDGVLRPAVIWPGEAADYYGPDMGAPIPVHDGGTGQSADPAPGQLLVGAPDASPAAAPAFVLGRLQGAQHAGEGDAKVANIVVDDSSALPNILLDTVQDIDENASPTFAALTVNGAIDGGSLAVTQNATIGGTLSVTGTTTLTGLLTANGGFSATSATVPTLNAAIIGSDDSGQFIKAARWDGKDASVGDATAYYAPGQGHAVRIEDGGTGLTTRPQALQMLIGRNDDATPAYVLADLVAGDNVSLSLSQVPVALDTNALTHGLPHPASGPTIGSGLPGLGPTINPTLPPGLVPIKTRNWQLRINATGGSSVAFPITPGQGGTGLTGAPTLGQILVGDGGGGFALGSVSGANNGRNIAVVATATGISLNTVQNLHRTATPTFTTVFLTKPREDLPATRSLGWNGDKGEVVLGGPSAGRQVRVFDTPDDLQKALAEFDQFGTADQAFVYRDQKSVETEMPVPKNDGQLLIIKALPKAGSIFLQSDRLDVGNIGMEPGQAVTLLASLAVGQWLLIGRS